MDKLTVKLDRVFKLVSAIPVSGDMVEVMSAIRSELRNAYAIAEQYEKEDTDG